MEVIMLEDRAYDYQQAIQFPELVEEDQSLDYNDS